MANRDFEQLECLNLEEKAIVGSFTTAAGGTAPTNVLGSGFTVARTGTGTFVVTLTDQYMRALGLFADFQAASPAGVLAQIGANNVTGQGSNPLQVTIETIASGSAADETGVVSFCFEVQNTSAPPT